MRTLSIVCISFLLTPLFVFAGNVSITEIMYDPAGTDTDHEWIEIYNSGSESIDLKDWRLVEAETNHLMAAFRGGTVLQAGQYAVVADKPEVFNSDYVGYSGIVLDSTFSLSNTGETLGLKNADIFSDTVAYSSNTGGNGNGESLQKINGEWKSASPTPGEAMQEAGGESNITVSGSSNSASIFTSQAEDKAISKSLAVEVPLIAVAGVHTVYKARLVGDKNNAYKCSVEWNFGDGAVEYGTEVYRKYSFPGEYVIHVEAWCQNKQYVEQKKIKVITAAVTISSVGTEGVLVKNNSAAELNISKWIIKGDQNIFTIPGNTYLLPYGQIGFSSSATKIYDPNLLLLTPDGQVVSQTVQLRNYSQYSYPEPTVSFVDDGEEIEKDADATIVESVVPQIESDDSPTAEEGGRGWLWVSAFVGFVLVAAGGFVWGNRFFGKNVNQENISDEIALID